MQSVTETIVITLQTNNLLLCLLGYPCKCFSSWHSFAVFVLGVRETERQHVEESNLIQFYGESKKRSSSSSKVAVVAANYLLEWSLIYFCILRGCRPLASLIRVSKLSLA